MSVSNRLDALLKVLISFGLFQIVDAFTLLLRLLLELLLCVDLVVFRLNLGFFLDLLLELKLFQEVFVSVQDAVGVTCNG